MIERVLVLVAVLAVTVALGVWWQRRQGVLRRAHRAPAATPGWADHGVVLGERRTFVQFSSAVCAPCRHTARVLGEVAAGHDDVTHHELDVDEHHDLVRGFGVLRTPTVLVLDADGQEVARASGAMSRAQALEALSGAPTRHPVD